MSPGYSVTMYGPDQGLIRPTFFMPSLPYPGLKLWGGEMVWVVTEVFAIPPGRGSDAERDQAPMLVEVRAELADGIFAS